jgi:ribosomal protein S17E
MPGEDTPKQHRNLMPPWKPGQSGNPAGRPKGARSILQEDFFKVLQRKFEENGEAVIDEMIRDKPADFAKMLAGLMTKEITGEDGAPLFPEAIAWKRAGSGN